MVQTVLYNYDYILVLTVQGDSILLYTLTKFSAILFKHQHSTFCKKMRGTKMLLRHIKIVNHVYLRTQIITNYC